MAIEDRVSQQITEVVEDKASTDARVSNQIVEFVNHQDIEARISQALVEFINHQSVEGRISQIVIEWPWKYKPTKGWKVYEV